MYDDRITNIELNTYPKPYIQNFSIKLSEILHKTNGEYDNGLFNIEEITENIYRICPLFNCKTITSSNKEDIIFGNELIICTQLENKETYFDFISDENEEIYGFINYNSYYQVGDRLSQKEYNSIVATMRMFGEINQDMNIQDSTILTDYGNYDFEFNGNILDNGIEINSTSLLKCKLSEAKFRFSKYTLNLKVLKIGNPNIDSNNDSYDIRIDTISVELINDSWVDIDVSELDIGDIILYDCNLEIKHNIPIIKSI